MTSSLLRKQPPFGACGVAGTYMPAGPSEGWWLVLVRKQTALLVTH